ncbi:MAG: hypothetical protein ACLFQJ_00765 [Campylobacterales bacterium]
MNHILSKTLLLGVLGLFFTACSPKITTLDSTSYFMVMKTETIRFADSGFIKKTANDGYYIELFSAGNALFWLLLEDGKVCSEDGCITQKNFIDSELSEYYPESILKNIISKKPIFDSTNLIKTPNGFRQKLQKSRKYDINYEVTKNSVYFKDNLNGILLNFKELH